MRYCRTVRLPADGVPTIAINMMRNVAIADAKDEIQKIKTRRVNYPHREDEKAIKSCSA